MYTLIQLILNPTYFDNNNVMRRLREFLSVAYCP